MASHSQTPLLSPPLQAALKHERDQSVQQRDQALAGAVKVCAVAGVLPVCAIPPRVFVLCNYMYDDVY